MTTSLQAVSGAIRATKGISISTKYSGGKMHRSPGVYAEQEKRTNRITIAYWSFHNSASNSVELAKAIQCLTSKGYKITEYQEPAFYGSSVIETKYQVELA